MHGYYLKMHSTDQEISDWYCWDCKLSCAFWQLFISQLQILALTQRPYFSPCAIWGFFSKRALMLSPSVVSQEQEKGFKRRSYSLAVPSWSCAKLLTITWKSREQRVAINLRRAELGSHPQQLVPASEGLWLNFSWILSFVFLSFVCINYSPQ